MASISPFSQVPNGRSLTSVLNRQDDPGKRADRVRDNWVVTKKVAFGVQDSEGRVLRASHLAIRRGDFGDVKVVASIVQYRDRSRSKEVSVHFGFERVVQILAEKNMPKVRHLLFQGSVVKCLPFLRHMRQRMFSLSPSSPWTTWILTNWRQRILTISESKRLMIQTELFQDIHDQARSLSSSLRKVYFSQVLL